MAKFLVTYHGAGMPSDPAAAEQAKAAFGAWVAQAGSAIVDPGAPLHPSAQVSNGAPAPGVEIGGYSIIQATDAAAATEILKAHPFVGRGGTLQLHEVMGV